MSGVTVRINLQQRQNSKVAVSENKQGGGGLNFHLWGYTARTVAYIS